MHQNLATGRYNEPSHQLWQKRFIAFVPRCWQVDVAVLVVVDGVAEGVRSFDIAVDSVTIVDVVHILLRPV